MAEHVLLKRRIGLGRFWRGGAPADLDRATLVRIRIADESEAAPEIIQDEGPVWRGHAGQAASLYAGRVLLGGYFLYNGINHFRNRTMLSGYARSKHVPLPDVAVPASGALIVLGGLSVLTGYRPRVGASLIAAFLLGVSPRMHAFWNEDGEPQRGREFVNFTKNAALVGAAALVAALPQPWPASVGARKESDGSATA